MPIKAPTVTIQMSEQQIGIKSDYSNIVNSFILSKVRFHIFQHIYKVYFDLEQENCM